MPATKPNSYWTLAVQGHWYTKTMYQRRTTELEGKAVSVIPSSQVRIEVESKLLGVKVVVVDSLCRLSARVSDYRYHGCDEGWNKTATGRGNITVVQGVTERSLAVCSFGRE